MLFGGLIIKMHETFCACGIRKPTPFKKGVICVEDCNGGGCPLAAEGCTALPYTLLIQPFPDVLYSFDKFQATVSAESTLCCLTLHEHFNMQQTSLVQGEFQRTFLCFTTSDQPARSQKQEQQKRIHAPCIRVSSKQSAPATPFQEQTLAAPVDAFGSGCDF